MDAFIAANESFLRLGGFAGAFLLFSGLEALFPRRGRSMARLARWGTNLGMVAIATLLVRVLILAAPLLATASAAAFAAEAGWGLFNAVGWPWWLEFALALAMLDLAIWFQHVVTHRVPILWRLHRIHHGDGDFDASTALRFHPVEIALSAAWKLSVILALGPSVAAVIVFEIALNACAIFNHSNLALPGWADRAIRLVLVTPDMHRVHHSHAPREHHRNFGFCLSVWDRVFRTYRAQPELGHEAMRIGLEPVDPRRASRLRDSLLGPVTWK